MIRRALCRVGLLSACWLVAAVSGPCAAGEPYALFLRGLMQRGYGEQSLAYLDQIAERPDLPAELKQTLDLERSKCLRLAAGETGDPQQRDIRLAEAKRLADKFFADNPTHPAAAAIVASAGDDKLVRGQNLLAQARFSQDAEAQTKFRTEARTELSEARTQYDKAASQLKERLDKLPKPDEKKAGGGNDLRADLEFSWVEARFKRSLCDYFLAQTYADPKSRERTAALKKASSGFDAIAQEFRGQRLALPGHLWHAKALEELGDTETAKDMYDEILGVAPMGPDPDPDLAGLFGQAEVFWLHLLGETDPKTVVQDGDDWLKSHKNWQRTPQYQGVALETAKARLKVAENTTLPAQKAKLIRDALDALTAIGKVESEYRPEAQQLRGNARKQSAGGTQSFDESMSLGNEAFAERNWSDAEKLFRQALESAKKSKDAKGTEAARTQLAQSLYRQALVAYSADSMDKVHEIVVEIVRDHADLPVAQDSSALAIAAALEKFTAAKDDVKAKAAARTRLELVADYAIKKWPDKPVCDDARMSLAQLCLLSSEIEPALQHLSQVQSQSKRYPTALQIRGQVRWKQYLDAKKAESAADRAEELKKFRGEAIANLQTSAAAQRGSWQAGSEPMPPALFDTHLLLGQIHLEGQEFTEAAAVYQPLVDSIKKVQPKAADVKVQQALIGAVRASLAMNSAKPAGDAALTLAAITPDEEQPNGVLVDLAKLVGIEIRKLEAAAGTSETPMTTEVAANPATLPLRELQGAILDPLTARKKLTVSQLIYLGDASVALSKNDKAREIYQRVLTEVDQDPAAKATAGAATTRIRARLVGLLRNEGQLDEANKQVSAILQAHPNALEPLMEKGYILQNLAERDPRRWDECIKHWSNLRVRLESSKPRPNEYYDVLYNAALSLVRQARQTNNKEKAILAEKMLKNSLILTPRLNGPDTVAKYEALLTAAASLRGPVASPPAPASAPGKK